MYIRRQIDITVLASHVAIVVCITYVSPNYITAKYGHNCFKCEELTLLLSPMFGCYWGYKFLNLRRSRFEDPQILQRIFKSDPI